MSCLAQLSADQKLIDFQVLAGLFAKNYGAYEWKRDAVKFDLYNVVPWITRINNSKSDLEFYEICAEYVTGLKDVHVEFFVPSDFEAKLGFNVDIYDGKYLIDAIDRTVLDAKAFPFQIGDELISIDGKSAQDWIDYISQFQSFGEVRPTSRYSAVFLTNRIQSVIPRAAEIGDKASVVVRLQSGELFTYQIPWTKTGTALTSEGPVPTPKVRAGFRTARRPRSNPLPPAAPTTVEEALRGVPAYKASLARLQFNYASKPIALRGVGDPRPVFKMPATFRQHSNPLIYDGVFTSGGLRIGYLRIPDFEPTDAADLDIAYTYFDREIKYLQANTDGLVVDVMRNFGGLATSRLNRNLRLDKHWSYGTQGVIQDARGQRPFLVLAPVQTDKTKESVAEVIKELGDIAGERPIRGEEFASIMRTQTLGLPGRWATLQALEAAAIQIVNYGYPDDYFSTYASRVRGLREAELDAAARKFIRPSQIVWVIVGDLSLIEKGVRELNLGTVTIVDAS